MKETIPLIASTLLLLVSCSPSEDIRSQSGSTNEVYLKLIDKPSDWAKVEKSLAARWELSQVTMALETMRLSRSQTLAWNLFKFLGDRTGKDFGPDRNVWQNWIWNQSYEPSEDYAAFKSDLYQRIDLKFGDYFDDDPKATIRLDEVVWGGVIQDGIPPLRQPKMIPVKSAKYLADSDIVFGIEVDGEARAYPKRILAWHEMFVDTIQGIPLAGVY
jgi:hypothetical protein